MSDMQSPRSYEELNYHFAKWQFSTFLLQGGGGGGGGEEIKLINTEND